MTEILNLSIKEINALLRNGEIKPLDLVNEAFLKIESSNLNAFITLNKEEALKKAKELELKEIDNPLFGIPIVLKDNIITKNLKTTAGSKMLENFVPVYNATVVEKINDANMIILGKANMDEFAMGSTGETSYFGSTLNPVDNTKVPGGSSSGSAAAVAAGLAPASLGSDTGGSIRQPSGFTGVTGLKPTYGRVSRYGLIAFASSLDQIGPITKTIEDNAIMMNMLAGYDSNDSTSAKCEKEDFTRLIGSDIKGMKIAVPKFYMNENINDEVKSAINNKIEYLKDNGATVDMVDIDYLEYAIPLYQIIALGEASSNLARFDGIRYGYSSDKKESLDELYKTSRSEGFGDEVKRRIMIGSYILSGDNAHLYFEKAQQVRNLIKTSFEKVFKDYDLIVGPVSTNVAYDLETKSDDALKSFYDDLLTIPVNMAGLPGLSMKIDENGEGLPIGMQIIGDRFDEATIYKLASFIEKGVK